VPDVLEPRSPEREALNTDPPTSPARPRSPHAGESRGGHLPDLVVLLALVFVTQDVVGRGDLLEPLLGLLVPCVGVRVVLLGEPSVGLLDLRGGGVLGNAQDLVVVLLEPLPTDVPIHGRRPCALLPNDLDSSGTKDAPLHRVALPQDVADHGFALPFTRLQ